MQTAPIRFPEERVVRNNWITDIYGMNLAYGDMNVLDIASVERQVDSFGALLLIEEQMGSALRLGQAASSFYEPSQDQLAVVEELSRLDASDNYIPSLLNDRALHEVPALYLSRAAIVKDNLLFKGILGERFAEALSYTEKTPQLDDPEKKELYDRAAALKSINLSPAAFIIEAAKAAHGIK